MIKACPRCGRPILKNCYHHGKVPSVEMPKKVAIEIAKKFVIHLKKTVDEHLNIIDKLREEL